MTDRHKKRPRPPAPEHHWLGSGPNIQDSLLLDLNPYTYSLDHLIVRQASQVAFRYEGREKRPLAVLFPPVESIPWQLGVLARNFDICIRAGASDQILEQAAERFNASLFIGELPPTVDSSADFILSTTVEWPSLSLIVEMLEQIHSLISEEGRGALVVPCVSKPDGDVEVLLSDGSSSLSIFEFLNESCFSKFRLRAYYDVPISKLRTYPDFGVNEFSKRHSDFFGKYGRDLCLSRIYEEDFQGILKDKNRCAVLIVVEGFVGLP